MFDRATKDDGGADGEYVPPDPASTTLDHVAFTIDLTDVDAERERLEDAGVALDVATHEWVSWRSMFWGEPEGNRFEFVCDDDTVGT